jgi:F-type H+-transporting ATPase subunit delta
VLEAYLDMAATRRDELTATVTVRSTSRSPSSRRPGCAAQLRRIYGKPVTSGRPRPDVVGGIRVQVGDEVVDGTVSARSTRPAAT